MPNLTQISFKLKISIMANDDGGCVQTYTNLRFQFILYFGFVSLSVFDLLH